MQSPEIGQNNHIFSNCVIGEIPQDKKFSGEKTKLIINFLKWVKKSYILTYLVMLNH